MRFHLPLLLSVIFLLYSSLFASAQDACNGDDYGTAGQFDFYVLQFSWPAEFCFSHSSFPGCEQPTAWQQNNLTLHGLWPNYKAVQSGHYWPQCCSSTYGTNLTAQEITPILSELQTFWPSEQNPDPAPSDYSNSLWGHEWAKHGTCEGSSPTQYFQKAMGLAQFPTLATPSVLSKNIGGSFALSDLQKYYNDGQACPSGQPCMVGTQCTGSSGSQFLEGITVCLDRTQKRIVCPAKVIIDKQDCSDASISLSSFNDSRRKPKHGEELREVISTM